jgi:hypothetical protein
MSSRPPTKEVLLRQADTLRDLARRTRRLSETMELESDRRLLTGQGQSFDAQAARIERHAAAVKV